MEFGLLSIAQVCNGLGVSRASVYRWIREEGFPAPIKLGPARSVWRRGEIEAWVEARAAKEM